MVIFAHLKTRRTFFYSMVIYVITIEEISSFKITFSKVIFKRFSKCEKHTLFQPESYYLENGSAIPDLLSFYISKNHEWAAVSFSTVHRNNLCSEVESKLKHKAIKSLWVRNGIFPAILINKECHNYPWLQPPWMVS